MLKKLIKNISIKLSLTDQEIKTIVFILLIVSLGLIIKFGNIKIPENRLEKSSFSFYDSLNKAIENQNLIPSKQNKILEKRVDSEQELLDFSVNKLDTDKKNKFSLEEHSLNLNSASEEILIKLPGIGPMTAEKIIDLRKSKKGYKKVDELLEIKGIGPAKLKAIKKYLYIDNKNF